MEMPGRKYTAQSYRYGFNGQEEDKEVFAGANTAEYWMYDARLGRRWEKDPKSYYWQSVYATFNNNPIYYKDPLGLEGDDSGNKDNGKSHQTLNTTPKKVFKEGMEKLGFVRKDQKLTWEKMLNSVVNSFKDKLDNFWSLSNSSKPTLEYAGVIVGKSGTYSIENGKLNATNGGFLDYSNLIKDEIKGTFHNHPYSTEEKINFEKHCNCNFNSNGVPSMTDIVYGTQSLADNSGGYKSGQFHIIDAGNKIFAVVIEDPQKVEKFINATIGMFGDSRLQALNTGMIISALNPKVNRGLDVEQRLLKSTLEYLNSKDPGVSIYVSESRTEPNFTKAKMPSTKNTKKKDIK
jgi:RHS repeat-associated protein